MMKQLIHKAKIKFFEPAGFSQTLIYPPADHRGADSMAQPFAPRRMTAEQQRISLLETQNQQLRADIARWKSSSLGFAHELRELLTD